MATEENSPTSYMESIMELVIAPLEVPANDIPATVRSISFLLCGVFFCLSLMLNVSILINICCTSKTSIGYFRILILYCIFHMVYQGCVLCVEGMVVLEPQLPLDTPVLSWLQDYLGIISRACLGVIFHLVCTLTIERFLATAVQGVVGFCLQLLCSLLALSCPALLASFHILTLSSPSSTPRLSYSELWFGLEVGLYIILPLFVLTIFGTINYCKISITSRLISSKQVCAVKTNISLVVLTNISIFLFLVQECMLLWREQLITRDPQDVPVKEMLDMVNVASLSVGIGLSFFQTLVPVFCLCIASTCCVSCCCPSINQLEDTRYELVISKQDHVNL